jgi:hypothetical protein
MGKTMLRATSTNVEFTKDYDSYITTLAIPAIMW